MAETKGYVPLTTTVWLLNRSKPWIWAKLAEYRDAKLVDRAKRWHLRRQFHPTLKHKPLKRPILVQYLLTVGIPDSLFQRLLWDSLREEWGKISKRLSHRGRRQIYQLNNWAAISSPSSMQPLLVPPPSSLKPSTTSSASRTRPSKPKCTAKP